MNETTIRERCEQARGRHVARIRAIHGQRCTTWETWTERVKDQDGRAFVGTFDGCRACGVAMLRPGSV
jgi:hypothetical protein